MPEAESRRLDDQNSSSNAVQNGSSPKSNGATGRQKKRDDFKQEGGVTESGQYPDRPGQQNCIYYLRTGSCGYGTNCRYNHPNYVAAQDAMYGIGDELPEREGEPDCAFFLKTRTCKYGSSCKYNHPRDNNGASPFSFNILGLPMRPEEISCKYYLRTGQCKFGPACKFHHPQPAVPGPVFPVNGNVPFGSAESSNLPIRAFPALPMPAPTYIYDSPIHTPQAYIPMAVSPPHGFLPQQGWNALTGNMSHISSTGTYGSSLSYNSNSKSLGESGSNGQVQYLPILTPYPERPDRPECRYYINYGACKYGQDCKYNHPKERMGQMLPQPLLPLAYPGQPLCSSYITYGICKNGPICEFRHQGGVYPMNYGLIPIPPTVPMPIFDGRKSSTVVISSETSSPSKSTKDLDGINNADSITEKTQHSDTNGQQESTTEKTQHSDTNGLQESTTEKTQPLDTNGQQEPTTEKTEPLDTNGQQESTTEKTQHSDANGQQKSHEEEEEEAGTLKDSSPPPSPKLHD